jgi:hypothetical protein
MSECVREQDVGNVVCKCMMEESSRFKCVFRPQCVLTAKLGLEAQVSYIRIMQSCLLLPTSAPSFLHTLPLIHTLTHSLTHHSLSVRSTLLIKRGAMSHEHMHVFDRVDVRPIRNSRDHIPSKALDRPLSRTC